MESEFLNWAKTQGPVILLLAFAIVFGYRQFTKYAAKQSADLKNAWDAKERESDKRFEDMKDRFNASDRRHDACDKEKQTLQSQLFQLACMTGNTDVLKIKPIKTPDET